MNPIEEIAHRSSEASLYEMLAEEAMVMKKIERWHSRLNKNEEETSND